MSKQKNKSEYTRESNIQKIVMVTVSKLGGRVFRNNTGALMDARGVPVRYGLCTGSSDLIGWTKDGRFLAIEVKRPNKRPTKKQQNFIDLVNSFGGLAFVATCEQDVLDNMG